MNATTNAAELPESERSAFEAFAIDCPMGRFEITRKSDGYWSSHTQIMWDTWQARAVLSAPLCPCKDRLATACPGEWEPGCDLGNNAEHVRVFEPARSQPCEADLAAANRHLREELRLARRAAAQSQ